ncbi:hypothetical protein [Desulfococcus multivorans]|jgi:hypothetical protein|uniref:hypothetical protein n=1 Tax=Desulfococcus multivorans TaxID=897 RepID=UPI00117E52D6|nr:hypothetical protein [Desulfococcus multivorans]
MSPITHFLIGWSVSTACNTTRKERLFITLAGVAPDIDGAGLIFDLLGFHQSGMSPLEVISPKANNSFVDTLRNRFGLPTKEIV